MKVPNPPCSGKGTAEAKGTEKLSFFLVSFKQTKKLVSKSFSMIGRALLVHTAQHPEFKADRFIGHGFANKTVEDILSCIDKNVTTVYQSRLRPTQAIKLPFPYINNLNYSGKVVVEWTIALSTEIDAKNTEDYS